MLTTTSFLNRKTPATTALYPGPCPVGGILRQGALRTSQENPADIPTPNLLYTFLWGRQKEFSIRLLFRKRHPASAESIHKRRGNELDTSHIMCAVVLTIFLYQVPNRQEKRVEQKKKKKNQK
jgi:hypothetical protein